MPGPPASSPLPMPLLLLLLLTVGSARAAPLPQTGAGERSPGAAGPLRLAGRRRGRRACGVGPPLRRIGGLRRAGGRGVRTILGRFLAAGAWDGGAGARRRGGGWGRRRGEVAETGSPTSLGDSSRTLNLLPKGPSSFCPLDTSSFFPDVTCLLWLFSRPIIRTVSYLSSFLK